MKNINKFLLLTFFAMNAANLQSIVTMVEASPTADPSTKPVTTQNYTVTNKTNVPVTFTYHYWIPNSQSFAMTGSMLFKITKSKLLAPGEVYTIPLASDLDVSYSITADNMGSTESWQNGQLSADNSNALQSLNITTAFTLNYQPANGGNMAQQITSPQDQLIRTQQNLQSGTYNCDDFVNNLKDQPMQQLIDFAQSQINESSDYLKTIPSFMTAKCADQINQLQSSINPLQAQIAVTEKLIPTLQPYMDQLNNWTQILFGWQGFAPTINGQSVPQALPEIAALTIDNKNKALAYIQTIPADTATQLGPMFTNIKDNITNFVPGNEFQPLPEAPVVSGQTIINNSNSPATMITVTFYDKDLNALNSPSDVWRNGGKIEIPKKANFIQGIYVASTQYNERITVLDMITIDPTKSYSLTNPNSKYKPKNSNAKWVLTSTSETKKKTGKGKWKEACKNDRSCRSGNCKNGFCTKS